MYSTHHGRRRVDVFQHRQVILFPRRQLAVKVDADSEDLGNDIADAEVGDERGVIHRQALGHCLSTAESIVHPRRGH